MSHNKSFNKSLSSATLIFRIFGAQYFTIDSKNDAFNYQDSGVSWKFKIYFAVILIGLSAQTGILTWLLLSKADKDDEKAREAAAMDTAGHVFMMVFLLLTVTHAYMSTSKVKEIFAHSQEIAHIFESSLAMDSDYDGFETTFEKFCIKFLIVITACTLFLIGFTYLYWPQELLNLIVFQILPYAFIEVTVLRFIFFIMLVNHNSQKIKEFFEIKIAEKNQSLINFGALQNMEFQKIIAVKEIYGLLRNMTRLINQVSGPSISIFFISLVLADTLGGYMIFLYIKDVVPVEEIGSTCAVSVENFA